MITLQKVKMMENWRIKGNWKQVKGKLQKKYGELTEDDLQYEEGQEKELIGRLQSKLGKSADEVKAAINELMEG